MGNRVPPPPTGVPPLQFPWTSHFNSAILLFTYALSRPARGNRFQADSCGGFLWSFVGFRGRKQQKGQITKRTQFCGWAAIAVPLAVCREGGAPRKYNGTSRRGVRLRFPPLDSGEWPGVGLRFAVALPTGLRKEPNFGRGRTRGWARHAVPLRGEIAVRCSRCPSPHLVERKGAPSGAEG